MSRVLHFETPPVVEVAGTSMEPSLLKGWKVRIEPTNDAPRAGDVVLLRCASGFVIHRVVHVFRLAGRVHVFHRGDGEGRTGLAGGDEVVGRASAVLVPRGDVPDLVRLDA